jgi:hypothetical protein
MGALRAFSSEVDAGLRQEIIQNKELKPCFASMEEKKARADGRTGKARAACAAPLFGSRKRWLSLSEP